MIEPTEHDRLSYHIDDNAAHLWDLVDFWSKRLLFAIDRYEGYQRRIMVIALAGVFAALMGAGSATILMTSEVILDSRTEELIKRLPILVMVLGLIVTAILAYNEIRGLKNLKREIADTYYVFREVQQMFIAAAEESYTFQPSSSADTRGRIMMMSYIERKAKRYI